VFHRDDEGSAFAFSSALALLQAPMQASPERLHPPASERIVITAWSGVKKYQAAEFLDLL
jgi:hypothetical protein